MPSPEIQGVLDDVIFFAPTVAIGSPTYADFLSRAKSPDEIKMIAIDVHDGSTDEQKRAAMIAVARHAPEMVFIEDLANQSLAPRPLLIKFWQSGFAMAGSIVAEDELTLFQGIGPGLAVPETDVEWLIGEEDGRCKVQVFFEGKSVTHRFVEWVRANSEC